jgi:hypothetical protein
MPGELSVARAGNSTKRDKRGYRARMAFSPAKAGLREPAVSRRVHEGMRDAAGEHRPGEPAPATGHYEEVNVFGTHTGRAHHAQQGEPLPGAPRGFCWRRVEDRQDEDGGS